MILLEIREFNILILLIQLIGKLKMSQKLSININAPKLFVALGVEIILPGFLLNFL